MAEDPDDDTARVLAHGKHNLSEPGESLRFRIEGVEVHRRDGLAVKTSRIAWIGSSTHSTADLLRSDRRREPRDSAEDWLIEQLRDAPVLVTELQAGASVHGHSWRTVERAKKELGIESIRRDPLGPWYWSQSLGEEEVAAWRDEDSVSAGQSHTATSLPVSGGVEAVLMGACPDCGAASPEPGYDGHGMHRSRFYSLGAATA